MTYLQADPATGQVTELDWVGDGTPTWQRVASADPPSQATAACGRPTRHGWPPARRGPGDGDHPGPGLVRAGRRIGDQGSWRRRPRDGRDRPRGLLHDATGHLRLADRRRRSARELLARHGRRARGLSRGADLRHAGWIAHAGLAGLRGHHHRRIHGQRITYAYPDGDATACDAQRFCLLQDRDTWNCLLSDQESGAIDTLWVVDPPENRNYLLVVVASGSPSPALRDEVNALVGSIKFYVE